MLDCGLFFRVIFAKETLILSVVIGFGKLDAFRNQTYVNVSEAWKVMGVGRGFQNLI
jgi:hypothetical protein